MQHAGSRFHVLSGLVLVVAMLAAFGLVSAARAQEDNSLASITIYTTICPVGYTGDTYFEDCYDNPAADITFFLDETTSATTGDDGFTSFEGIDVEGEFLLQIDVPGDFTDFVAFCSDEFGDPFEFVYATELGGILLDLTLDDDLRCDFYIIPEDASGGPTATTAPANPTTAPANPTVGTLPNTGAGSSDGEGSVLWSLAGALALIVVASIVLGRGRLARATIRTER